MSFYTTWGRKRHPAFFKYHCKYSIEELFDPLTLADPIKSISSTKFTKLIKALFGYINSPGWW